MLRNVRLIAATLLAVALALPTHAQGPVVLMGIDLEDRNISGGNHGGLTPYTDVFVNGILPNVNNGGSGILVIGGGKTGTDDVTAFWDALGSAVGETITYSNGAASITAQSFAGFAVVAIASSIIETPDNGLTDAENNALGGRATDIKNHVNGGGGLFGSSQGGLTTPYGYLGSIGSFTFNFPPDFEEVTATVDGEAIGITDTNLDVCCWHDEYLTFPGFLNVLATNDATSNPCALGGTEVIIVQGIVLTPLVAQNPVGTTHTVTATVADNNGDPVVGVTVTFTVISGPHTGTMDTDVTDINGQAFFTYLGVALGLDTIEGCFIDNTMTEQCAQVTKEWVPNCYVLDFETTDDFTTPLLNGQEIDTEFGLKVVISGAGSNLGPTIFDTTPGGPNDPSINDDMLISQGNMLLLQHNSYPGQTNAGFFDIVTDDNNGGDLIFDFVQEVSPRSVLLADINPPPNQGASVTLTDVNGKTRVYAVEPGWTGTYGDAGPWLLDLTTTIAQPGNGTPRFATATDMLGYLPDNVVRMVVHMTGYGAMDELSVCALTAGMLRAEVSVRNGTGVNPMTLTNVSMPVLGGTWAANLDCSAFGSGTAMLVVRSVATSSMTPYGELLILGSLLHSEIRTHNGSVVQLSWHVPNDMALYGLSLHAQGLTMGRASSVGANPKGTRRVRGSLSNALDLTLGF